MARPAGESLHVVHVSFLSDTQKRDGETLLEAWPTLSAVACAVARAGIRVTVVQTAHADETIERDGVAFRFVSDMSRGRRRVVDCVQSLAPDVVHAQGLHYAFAIRGVARATRSPVIVQDHLGVPPRGWRRLAWRWGFTSIAATAHTTRDQRDPWVKAGVLRASLPVFEVLEGSSSFTPGDQAAARLATGISGDPCLLWTSRLNAWKRPLDMLDAVEDAAARLPDLRLWCCFGQATMLDQVRARIGNSPMLRQRVTMLGARPRDAMELLYRAADYYVQTSDREGSGYSLLEALSCGTPAFAADIPPTRRILGDAGALTPVGDSAAMANAIVEWSRGDRAAQRRRARARFESELTFDAIGRRLRDVYEALVRSRE